MQAIGYNKNQQMLLKHWEISKSPTKITEEITL